MGQLKNTGFESGTSHLCPVTGLAIFGRPEWTDVSFGNDYRVTIRILGDSILLVKASGHATLHDVKHAVMLDREVLTKAISVGRPYIKIEDWSDLKGTSRKAREYYINYIKNRQRLVSLIFCNLSIFFKIAVKFGMRFNILKFKVEIVDNYTDAVKLAQKILSTSQTEIDDSLANATSLPPNLSLREGSTNKIIANPQWHIQTENYSLRFEVINDYVLHGITTGRLEKEHIDPSMRMQMEVTKSMSLSGSPYSYVLGLEGSDGTGQNTRKQYVRAILDLHKKCPFNMLIFYGANRLVKAGINIAGPFVPFKVRVVKDLDSALNLIDKEKSKNIVPAPLLADKDSARKSLTPDQTQQYVNELLKFIGKINWEIDGTIEEAEGDHSHPFSPVFDAINLIKWELDDLWARQKRIEEELKKAKEAAEGASRAKSKFLANMSHELRTPLNHILGFTELVVDKKFGDLNETQEEYLNDVLSSSKHLLSLINDILDLSKVEAGKLELQMSDVNLKLLLENSLVMVKEMALKHGIRTATDLDGVPETVQADERKLQQILYNLLSNAVKFTPEGGEILLSANLAESSKLKAQGEKIPFQLPASDVELHRHWIAISVADTGIGIKPQDLEKIFNPFEQVENSTSRKYQGTGLGLSLTKSLVELHGGSIRAESEGEMKGSTFRIVLPA